MDPEKREIRYGWPEGHRACLECKEVKPFSEFHKHAMCAGGYNSVCKQCRLPRSKAGYARRTLEQCMLDAAKQRAVKSGRDFNLDLSDIVIPDECPVLRIPFGETGTWQAPSLDRVDSTLGYVKGNVRVISKRANTLKSNATLEEMELVLQDAERLLEWPDLHLPPINLHNVPRQK